MASTALAPWFRRRGGHGSDRIRSAGRPAHLAAALVAILPIAIAIRAIPDGTGKNAAEVAHGEAKGLPVWRDAQLLLIGVIVTAMAFAEGSANDWLPLLMVDGHGFSPTSGSLIYAGFTLGMTLGRFTGGWFIDRYSRVAVVRGSAVMGALGIGLIIFVDNPGWRASRCCCGALAPRSASR